MAKSKESHKRSLAKAMSWRLIAMLITMVVSYFVIKEEQAAGWIMAVSIGLVDSAVKIFAYYGHERMWLRFDFGSSSKPEYEI
jgi:adenylylsulfate kinase